MLGVVPPVDVIGVVAPTLVTPVPAGVAQDPSPRQNVVALALVPLFRFVTGRFPVTVVERSTFPHAGAKPTPPDSKALPVATSLNFASEIPVSAYRR